MSKTKKLPRPPASEARFSGSLESLSQSLHFKDKSESLEVLLAKISLPRVVVCDALSLPPHHQHNSYILQPLMLHQKSRTCKTRARTLEYDRQLADFRVVGNDLIIPADYPGEISCTSHCNSGCPDLGSKCVRSDKSGTFSDHILVHFGSGSQNVLKSDLEKSRNFPFMPKSCITAWLS